jgi:hypothetical protein
MVMTVGSTPELVAGAKPERWRAWYCDGRTYTDRELRVEELPRDGLVVVAVLRDGKQEYVRGPCMWHYAGAWAAGDAPAEAPEGAQIFAGTQMPSADWIRLRERVISSF